MQVPAAPQPVVLIASDSEWVGRSIESVLRQNGFVADRVRKGGEALDTIHRMRPDAVILDDDLGEMRGIDVCRILREDPRFGRAVAVIVLGAPGNRERMDAYRAGAWDFCTHPLDVDVLVLKLRTFTQARLEVQALRSASLVDARTGLYSELGIRRWALELGAIAQRRSEPMACVALSVQQERTYTPPPATLDDAASEMAELCRDESRRSDIVGRVGPSTFAILTPATAPGGVARFVERLKRTAEQVVADRSQVRIGYCAVADLAQTGLDGHAVVERALAALDAAGRPESAQPVVRFDEGV